MRAFADRVMADARRFDRLVRRDPRGVGTQEVQHLQNERKAKQSRES
jgi:hypothetical protein